MPEDKDEQTPGLKPTAEPRPLRPTVLPAVDATPRKKARGGASQANAPRTSTAGAPAVRSPTAVPGVESRRIAVSTQDLRLLSPGAAAEVYERARELVGTFVASERRAILWGHEAQKSYGDLVAATLTLSQAPLLGRVEGYLSRMMDILGAIDIMAIAGRSAGALGDLFRSANRKIDTPEELGVAKGELDQLLKHLGVALHDLLDLRDELEQHSRRVSEIAFEVEASMLAALFLSRHGPKGNDLLLERLNERSMSLAQTLAQIRSGDSMRELQIEQPVRMVRAVQDVALVMMPGFLGGLASAVALIERKGLTPTQAGELSHQLKDILQRLRT